MATLLKEIIKSLRDSMPPWHWSNFSDQGPQNLRNRKAHTEYLFQRGKLTDLWQDVGNGIVSALQRTQTLSSYFPTVQMLLFQGWQLYTFSLLLRSFFRVMEKAFQCTVKNHTSQSFPTLTHPQEAITAGPQKGSQHLLPTHPLHTMKQLKEQGKRIKTLNV